MDYTRPPDEIVEIDTPEGHQDILRSEWTRFAAFAWRKYLSEGRGAVVINLRRGAQTGSRLQIPTSYIAEASPRLAKMGGWPSEEIAQIVGEYDPEQDVVFIFLRLDGDLVHYLVSDDLTPPQAHQTGALF